MDGNIVLCGFMGCGKTSVGKRAAKLMNRKFCDLDQYIERKEGLKVSQIFERFGEAGFREREAAAVREIAEKTNMVVACGGGTVLFPDNVQAFHAGKGTILYLDVPLPALQERLKGDRKRPLLQKPNRRKVIAELYEQRCPLYQASADLTVEAGAPACVVAKRIAEAFL